MAKSAAAVEKAVVAFALGLPAAREDFPWGERVAKVGKKVFVFMGKPASSKFGMSVKLPESGSDVLALPFASPTGYGLGKSGWVSLQFASADAIPPVAVLCEWIEESYRAVAPKTLVKELDGGAAVSAPRPRTAARRPSSRRSPKASKRRRKT